MKGRAHSSWWNHIELLPNPAGLVFSAFKCYTCGSVSPSSPTTFPADFQPHFFSPSCRPAQWQTAAEHSWRIAGEQNPACLNKRNGCVPQKLVEFKNRAVGKVKMDFHPWSGHKAPSNECLSVGCVNGQLLITTLSGDYNLWVLWRRPVQTAPCLIEPEWA